MYICISLTLRTIFKWFFRTWNTAALRWSHSHAAAFDSGPMPCLQTPSSCSLTPANAALSLVNGWGCVLWLVNGCEPALSGQYSLLHETNAQAFMHLTFLVAEFCIMLPRIWEFPDWQILTIINYDISILYIDSLLVLKIIFRKLRGLVISFHDKTILIHIKVNVIKSMMWMDVEWKALLLIIWHLFKRLSISYIVFTSIWSIDLFGCLSHSWCWCCCPRVPWALSVDQKIIVCSDFAAFVLVQHCQTHCLRLIQILSSDRLAVSLDWKIGAHIPCIYWRKLFVLTNTTSHSPQNINKQKVKGKKGIWKCY